MVLLVGTSGFKYDDWKGVFYPSNIADRDLLPFYSGVFATVELDFTYYHMPGVKVMRALEQKTPPRFQFCVKAHRGMTHEIGSDTQQEDAFSAFRLSLEPMIVSEKLGCVLLQFPWKFRPTEVNRSYITKCRERMGDIPLVIEFRNSEWLTESTFRLLRNLGLGYCCVDEPRLKGLVPPVVAATSPVGYVRFHGRNAQKWWKHDMPSERYDYLYSEEELEEWVPRIRSLGLKTSTTFVLFNNCHAGKASVNAVRMKHLLMEEAGGG